jgi:hypothetical protein
MIVLQQSVETRTALDREDHRVVVARRDTRPDESTAQPLVKSFSMIMGTELVKPMPKVALTEDHELVEALVPIPGDLQHPASVRIDAGPGDMHGAGLQLDDEEEHVPNRADDVQRLDSEEVTGLERLPVAPEELLPRPFPVSLRHRLDAGLRSPSAACRAFGSGNCRASLRRAAGTRPE